MAYASETLSTRGGLVAQAQGFAGGLAARYAKYRLYRQTVTALGELSNRELADLGLTRGEIRSVARETAYRA
ncbi:MAG: DUF1127 domain-containing protein [Shimia sp.]